MDHGKEPVDEAGITYLSYNQDTTAQLNEKSLLQPDISVQLFLNFALAGPGSYNRYKNRPQAVVCVRWEGLEPSRLAAHGPQPCLSANSSTSAK